MIRQFRIRDLGDPDEEFDRCAQDDWEEVWGVMGGVDRLPKEAGDETDSMVISLVGNAINARGAAFGSQNESSQVAPIGGGGGRHF